MFDWLQFLNDHGIEYTESGRNVSKGNIALACPFCNQSGDPDPSQHMNISLKGRGWACWREASHRGISKARLVQALLNVSWQKACELAGVEEAPLYVHGDYLAKLQELYPSEPITTVAKMNMPRDWQPLADAKGVTAELFFNYMKDKRTFSRNDTTTLARRYDLQISHQEQWAKRIIFPIRDERGRLVNYTARAIGNKTALRYKTAKTQDAAQRMSQCVLDLPRLMRTEGEVLVIVEGPFDVMRLSWIGESLGVFATCCFTANITSFQGSLINRMIGFRKKYIMFDRAAMIQALKAKEMVPEAELAWVPEGTKDPGELEASDALTLCRQLVGAT